MWSRTAWIRVFAAATVTWAAALPLAAYAAGRTHAAAPIYAFAFVLYGVGSAVCHQLPERSFHLWSVQMPVCARCTGIYVGAALGALSGVLREPGQRMPRARLVLALAAAPTAATLLVEWAAGWMPPGWIRAGAGLLLGAAVSRIVIGASPSPDPSAAVGQTPVAERRPGSGPGEVEVD